MKPAFICERLTDLERRYNGPIPSHRKTMRPCGNETPEQIAQAVAWAEEQARSEAIKLDLLTANAGHPAMSNLESVIAHDRMLHQRNRTRAALNLRDAWRAAK